MKKPARLVVALALALLLGAVTACGPAPTPTSLPPITPAPTLVPPDPDATLGQLTPHPTGTPLSTATSDPTSTAVGGNFGRIAFVSSNPARGRFDTYVMNADGTERLKLWNNLNPVYGLAWSPDGEQIAFVAVDPSDLDEELYVINADGSGLTQLTSNGSLQASPAWSPDGRRIAFTSFRDSEDGIIYVMDADGGNQTRLTQGFSPAWSADGTAIAFNRLSDDVPELGIWVIDLDDGRQTQLKDHKFVGQYLDWSPDGAKIAFSYSGSSTNDVLTIYIMDADGGNQTKLTEGSDPSWSPDGNMIAFVHGEDIYVINADGSQETRLTKGSDPTWSPIFQHPDCTSGWSRLAAGLEARVSVGTAAPNHLRSGPSQADEAFALLEPGTPMKLLQGPVCADGFVFWKVAVGRSLGWTAEGDESEYWLEPYSP